MLILENKLIFNLLIIVNLEAGGRLLFPIALLFDQSVSNLFIKVLIFVKCKQMRVKRLRYVTRDTLVCSLIYIFKAKADM
jgi:hypothetical protein